MSIIMPRASMISAVRRLGLTSGLKLCLDAGDNASYDAAVQTDKWLDVSGNGYDFFRGSGTGGDAADPTFNGTAGKRSGGEYWSLDGGDYFTYDTTNETWMQNLHKDNAKYSWLSWAYFGSNGSTAALFGTDGIGGSGIRGHLATGAVVQTMSNNAGAAAFAINKGGYPTTTWVLCGASVDEAVGAGGALALRNNSISTGDSTFTSPASGNATRTFQICAAGNAGIPLLSGGRIASFLMWEGRALSAGELQAFFLATRGKFGV